MVIHVPVRCFPKNNQSRVYGRSVGRGRKGRQIYGVASQGVQRGVSVVMFLETRLEVLLHGCTTLWIVTFIYLYGGGDSSAPVHSFVTRHGYLTIKPGIIPFEAEHRSYSKQGRDMPTFARQASLRREAAPDTIRHRYRILNS